MRYDTNQYFTIAALVISILALIFAWTAYNRAGVDLSTQVELQVEEERREVQRELAVAEARIRLASIRAEIAAEEFTEESADEIADVREELAEAYSDTTGEVREGWETMDQGLEVLELQIREGAAESLATLDDVVENMRSGVSVTPRKQCLDQGGEWTQFPNSCVDSCEYRRNPDMVCAQVITMGCNCGEGECWNGVTCETI